MVVKGAIYAIYLKNGKPIKFVREDEIDSQFKTILSKLGYKKLGPYLARIVHG